MKSRKKLEKIKGKEADARENYLEHLTQYLRDQSESAPPKVDLAMFIALCSWIDRRNAEHRYNLEQLIRQLNKKEQYEKSSN